jgi:threonine synthase
MMQYLSTRGSAPVLSFEEATLSGLARDGGLYVPQEYPVFSHEQWQRLAGLPYDALAVEVMRPFVEGSIPLDDLKTLCAKTYAPFRHKAVAPLVQLGQGRWLMELFHGPTLAFKDYALQLLGHLFDYFLARRGERITIVGATSGDTGSAAIEACRDKSTMRIFILHPHGRVSPVQRKQMTSILSPNVHNLALEGTFDDAQDIVKALFNNPTFRDAHHLSAVNSINWARILGQVVYYVAAALALGAPHRPVSFAVPTGNFGNVFAAYVATRMGLPIERLIIATNRNDILARFWQTGEMRMQAVTPSLSPSMDIQVSSNIERLLFERWGRDGGKVRDQFTQFRVTGSFAVSATEHAALSQLFQASATDDAQTLAEIRRVYTETGMLIDPHTATGTAAMRQTGSEAPVIALACAHPAKFPVAVQQATGIEPALPSFLADLHDRPERMTVLPATVSAVQAVVEKS